MRNYRYKHLALGGTFDHLHKGHEEFLSRAFEIAEKVTIAISSDILAEDKLHATSIQPFLERKKGVFDFLKAQSLDSRANFVELNDIYGPAATSEEFDSILATRETHKNAVKINKLRRRKKLPALVIVSVELVHGDDKKVIRSKRIRVGEINREGFLYKKLFPSRHLSLPQELRFQLKAPLGFLIPEHHAAEKVTAYIKDNKPTIVISVGDIITNTLRALKFEPHIAIIDYRSRRVSLVRPSRLSNQNQHENKAGTINAKTSRVIKKAIQAAFTHHKKQTIVIHGEEDLLALPSVLFAPLGAVVLYGQVDTGVVVIPVTEESKEKARKLVEQFV